MLTSYYDNANALQQQNNWYLYDQMNRITLSQGVLSGSSIVINTTQGVQLAYDGAGNRRTAASYQGGTLVTETYNYDGNNRLTTTSRGGQLTSSRTYDAAGRVLQQITYSSPGTIGERRESTYNANGWLLDQKNYNGSSTLQSTITYTGYDGLGNVTTYNVAVHTGTAYTNYYSYSYVKFDSRKESVVSGTSTYFQPGSTTSTYDVNGNPTGVTETFATNRSRTFVTDQSGHILRKTENGVTQHYFYLNDAPVGSSGGLSAADFDYNYTPVSAQYPAVTPGHYVVSQGDTLRSIALAVFGDAQLWYLIADANGLQGDGDLVVGRNLTIPNRITNLHNDYQTFKPYSPGAIIGDTTPTLPDPPPPPAASGGGGCGGVGTLIVAIVAVVATVLTAGAALPALAGQVGVYGSAWSIGTAALSGGFAGMGLSGAVIGAGLIGGAVGSIAGQLVGNALGVSDGFSWGAVAVSAITGGVTAGTGGVGLASALGAPQGGALVANAIANNALTQGLNIITGQQDKFSWKAVAASAIAAPISNFVGGSVGNSDLFKNDVRLGHLAGQFSAGLTSGVIRQAIAGRVDFMNVAADAFGNALGNALGYSIAGGSGKVSSSSRAQDESLQDVQRQAMAQGYGPLTPEAASQVVSGQWGERNGSELEISPGRINFAGGNSVRELLGLGIPDSSYTPGDIGKQLMSSLASLQDSMTPDRRDFARYAEIRTEATQGIQSAIQALNSDQGLRKTELELLPKVVNAKGLNDLTEYVKNTSILDKDFAPTVFNALFSRQMDIGARAHFVANLPTEIVDQFGALAEIAVNTPQTLNERELVKSFGITIALAAEANRPFAAAAGLNALRAWDTITNKASIGAKSATSISDGAFVRFDPAAFDGSINAGGIQTRYFSDGKIWLTKYEDIKNITNASDLNTVLYRKNLWPVTQGKFDGGATLRIVGNVKDPIPSGVTNMTNGVRQWHITSDIAPQDMSVLYRIPSKR